MKKSLIFFTLSILSFAISAQKEKNIWYFGSNAGLDFRTGVPIALTNSSMLTYDNCASIADKETGELLFYSNGVNVWNKNHKVMPNGGGLLGTTSAGNSAFTVKQPGNNSLYYLFTNDAFAGPNGLRYSVIDVSLNGGLGDVTNSKNIILLNSSTEKITAIQHSNKNDIWIVTHRWNSNSFYVYLLNSSGLNTNPIISSIGSTHSGGTSGTYNALGQISANQAGNKVALSIYEQNVFEIFDFDRTNGTLSNYIFIPNRSKSWGVEFSPDGNFLYTTQWGGETAADLIQFDLSSNNQTTIRSSAVKIGTVTSPDPTYKAGYMQLGPDNKIYVAKYTSDFLGVIQFPNKKGLACNYNDSGVSLSGRQCQAGLPSFMQTKDIQTNVEEVELYSKKLVISPNPTMQDINITFFSQIRNGELMLQSVHGQTLYRTPLENCNSITIPRGSLPPGIYIVKVIQGNYILDNQKVILVE